MLVPLLLFLALQQPAPPDAHAIVQQATRAVEQDSLAPVEARWLRDLVAHPQDHRALLGLATTARLTARSARADSFATRLVKDAGTTPDEFSVVARIGIAQTLANGSTPVLADSMLALARREAQHLATPRLESFALQVLAGVRSRTLGTRAALALIRDSHAIYPVGTAQEEALRRCVEGSYGARLGEPAGQAMLDSGVNAARAAAEWRTYAHCRLLRAQIYEARGYFGGAIANLDTAVYWMRRTRADAALAVALQWGAFVRSHDGDLARARRDYLEATVLSARTGDAAVEAWSYTGLAQIALSVSDLTAGREYLTRARALHVARNDRWGYATVRELDGDLSDAIGDVPAAREALTESIRTEVSIGQPLLAISPLRRLFRVELESGRLDAADSALNAAETYAVTSKNVGFINELPFHRAGLAMARGRLDHADSLLRSMTRMERDSSSQDDLAYHYWIRRAELAMRRQEFDGAERAMQQAVALLARWRGVQGDKELRLRVAQARRPWGTFGEEAPALIARLAGAGRVSAAFALSEATRARELLRTALQRAALNPDSTHTAAVATRYRTASAAATLAQVQQSLDDSTAMLAYVAGRGPAPTTLFVITHDRADVRTLLPLDSLTGSLDRFVRLTTADAAPVAVSRSLGDALLTPAIATLPARVSRLVIIPELSLYRVPFDALPMADGRFVAERFSVTIAPSATWAMATADGIARTDGSLLAFGDVVSSGEAGALRSAPAGDAAAPIPLMPRLPYSGTEVRRIARYAAHARVLVRRAASSDTLRSLDLRDVRILHFATHALLDDRSLQRNLLALSPGRHDDGTLDPDALGALAINRALVVLSGCHTVGGIVLGAEGLRGLTAPLLEAGARAVVATQWAIGDQSTLPFIDRLYAHLAGGDDVATALRSAKKDAIRAHVRPAVWAAFTLVGDGTMRAPLSPAAGALLPWGRAIAAH